MLSVPVWGSLARAFLPGCHVAVLVLALVLVLVLMLVLMADALSVDVVRSSGWWCELESMAGWGLVLVAKHC